MLSCVEHEKKSYNPGACSLRLFAAPKYMFKLLSNTYKKISEGLTNNWSFFYMAYVIQ